MATIAEQLTSLANTKTAIKEAIINKGVAVADTDPFSAYPDKIGQISSGGGAPATKFGVSIDNLLGDVDKNGKYVRPSNEFVLDLTGIRTVGSYGFYHKFEYVGAGKITKIIANDLEIAGAYSFHSAFIGQSGIKEASFGITEISENYAFYSAFDAAKKTAVFSNLKKVSGQSAFQNVFANTTDNVDVDTIFPALEEISGTQSFSTFVAYRYISTYRFSSVKKITGATSAYTSTFGSVYSNTRWDFPNATEFTDYIWNVSSSYAGEIHFAAANQAAIEACAGYDKKWGFSAATIYFDLMLSITVNGVVYSRKHTIGGYTSWEDTDGNIVYTDATSEPAADTPVYSDQGTTQVGTVSAVA